MHDRPVDGKVASLKIGLVHKSVAFEAVKVGSISVRKMNKTYILSPPYELKILMGKKIKFNRLDYYVRRQKQVGKEQNDKCKKKIQASLYKLGVA